MVTASLIGELKLAFPIRRAERPENLTLGRFSTETGRKAKREAPERLCHTPGKWNRECV